jgi:hypothetical protein
MLHESCDKPRRDTCETKDIRAKHLAEELLRAANAGTPIAFRHGPAASSLLREVNDGTPELFRRGVIPSSMLRPKYRCVPEPEYVVEEVYSELGQLVYADDGTVAFCEIRVA